MEIIEKLVGRSSRSWQRFFCLVEGVSVLHESIKEDARRLVERLPADATWEDLQYEIYVRQAIDAGLKDSRDRRIVPAEEVRRQFGLEGQ
jgi:hypothetical protein